MPLCQWSPVFHRSRPRPGPLSGGRTAAESSGGRSLSRAVTGWFDGVPEAENHPGVGKHRSDTGLVEEHEEHSFWPIYFPLYVGLWVSLQIHFRKAIIENPDLRVPSIQQTVLSTSGKHLNSIDTSCFLFNCRWVFKFYMISNDLCFPFFVPPKRHRSAPDRLRWTAGRRGEEFHPVGQEPV